MVDHRLWMVYFDLAADRRVETCVFHTNIVTQPSVSRARGNCQTCSSIYSNGMVERASQQAGRRADRLVGEHADKTPALAC